jgi:hypothetical protein
VSGPAGDAPPAVGDRPATAHGADVEHLAALARQARIARCEAELQAALGPILARHRCRLATRQEIVDGRPGPVYIVVAAVE